ncbi:Tat pathway signal protein [Asticcacaulis sp. EMRT-3]|uniref:Tat pathway signal protein n=1 Tax=Asticcacaulis sp. EMRT-3 TaxID=3040349 RepID=UPI0024AF5110|nr:Tat pathway signal protein [Asticcacaulis sp. EMRT-3]MDI7776113.1 Tat pathway signal protein [Asticcacaulis sp. EMRT-3]
MIKRRHLLLLPVLASAPALLSAAPVFAETKKKGGGDGYTQFPTINVFTDADRLRHGTMSVDLGLYSDDPKLVAQIKLYMPRLQDAYVTVLQGYGGTLNRTSVVDTNYISMQLQAVTDRILQVHGAKVLLGSILLN